MGFVNMCVCVSERMLGATETPRSAITVTAQVILEYYFSYLILFDNNVSFE